MALSFLRWCVALFAALAILIVILMREPEPRGRNTLDASDLRLRERRAQRYTAEAAARLRLLQIRDSVRRAIGAGPAATSRAIVSEGVPEAVRRVAQQLFTMTREDRAPTVRIPTDIVFVVDTARFVRGIEQPHPPGRISMDYVLPQQGSNSRCLAIVRVVPNPRIDAEAGLRRALLRDETRQRWLGPCVFYEWFGMPGQQIDGWLRRRGWELAELASWDKAVPPWRPYIRYWDRVPFAGEGWGLRSQASAVGFDCAAGDTDACERAVLERPAPDPLRATDITFWNDGIISPAMGFDQIWRESRWFYSHSELGPRESTLLAYMVFDLGPERFARFWRSNASPRDAFREASGIELGDWTRRWAKYMYGPQSHGPEFDVMDMAIGSSLALLALALALSASRRRQVT